MPHYTGVATTMTEVMTALRNACVANGWTLSGEVLHKGAAYVQTYVATQVVGFGESLFIRGGTGIDGSNVLTGAHPLSFRTGALKRMNLDTEWMPMTFPVTYDLHVMTGPDEVFLFINHDGDRYSPVMFGVSDMAALVGGTGLWLFALSNSSVDQHYGMFSNPNGANWSSYGNNRESGFCAGLFTCKDPLDHYTGYKGDNSAFHHAIEGTPVWTRQATTPRALAATAPLLARMPSQLNGSSPLLPVQGYIPRPDFMVSMVLNLAHIRYMRNDNFDPGQVFNVGPDSWKSYPWLQKNTVARDGGGTYANHSGTMAYAIRYDGA